MKKLTTVLLLVPLLGIAIYYLSQIQVGDKASSFDSKLDLTEIESRKSKIDIKKVSKESSEINDSRARNLDKVTMMSLDLANEWANLKPSNFGNNREFLLQKHNDIFDSWNLSSSTRKKFVAILAEQSVHMADVTRKASTSWPLEVGHSANRKLNSAHGRKLLDEYKRIEADTRQKLIELVGAGRVSEFEMTRSKSSKDDD